MSGQHTPEPWGYGIVRDGKVVGIERTIAVAKHWVDADYVPLVPMSQRDELLAAASAVVERWDSPLWKDLPHTGEYIHRLREAIARVKGGAA